MALHFLLLQLMLKAKFLSLKNISQTDFVGFFTWLKWIGFDLSFLTGLDDNHQEYLIIFMSKAKRYSPHPTLSIRKDFFFFFFPYVSTVNSHLNSCKAPMKIWAEGISKHLWSCVSSRFSCISPIGTGPSVTAPTQQCAQSCSQLMWVTSCPDRVTGCNRVTNISQLAAVCPAHANSQSGSPHWCLADKAQRLICTMLSKW